MGDPSELGIVALSAAYRAKELDPVRVTEAYLTRIAKHDTSLHSYITVATDSAMSAAETSRGRWIVDRPIGLLDGIPIAIKDNIDVAGMPCTAGTAAFRERVPEADAYVVAQLRQHGAVLLGKLNMHEGALGATTDNPVFGRCMNPARPGYTPGGSSGGSAAAVAAQLCVAALGTDTMGSIRVPAAYCGVYGFKPSNDAMRMDGVVPLSFTLDCVGPLARSVEDVSILAGALLRPPPRATQAPAAANAAGSLARLRVGMPLQLQEVELAGPVASAFAQFLDELRSADAIVVPLDISGWHPAKARRAGLLISEAEGHLYYARHLGTELDGLSPQFAAMLCYPAQAGLSRLISAYELLGAVRRSCLDAFAEVDVIALPTAPQSSFPHGIEVPVNQADCTALANFARAPTITLPFPGHELPIGMQLMVPPGDDLQLLAVAAAVDQLIARHRA